MSAADHPQSVSQFEDSGPDHADVAATPGDHGDESTGEVPKKKPHRRIDWGAAERAYVQGIDVDGLWTFPSLTEIAGMFTVSRRQVAHWSGKRGWAQKREDFRTETALRLAGADMHRRIAEAERADKRTLRTGYRLLERVAGILEHVVDAKTLRDASTAALAARKLIVEAIGIHREDVTAESEERRRRADTVQDDPINELVDRVLALEDEEAFLRGIDALMGGPPVVIDVKAKALPAETGPTSRDETGKLSTTPH